MEVFMLRWSMIFFVFSVVAALLGFTGLSASTGNIAQTLFYVFIFLFIASALSGVFLDDKNKRSNIL
jgi:uncharacterized membrane protein YtjA (UPF0391 family)